MLEIATNPDVVRTVLDAVTDSIIRWLQAQLDSIHDPQGIMLLDDIVGMVSQEHYDSLVHPYLQRIFTAFQGLIRVYHNDTPCPTC